MDLVLHLIIVWVIYVLAVVALNHVLGHGGVLSVGHSAFYGVGAYTCAILGTRSKVDVLWLLAAAFGAALASSFLIAPLVRRLRDESLVLVTLGFVMTFGAAVNSCIAITRGPLGIANIPPPVLMGHTVTSRTSFAIIATVACLGLVALLRRVERSPIGVILRSQIDGDDIALAFGHDPRHWRIAALAISAGATGVAGALHALYVGYIDPTSFSINESILLVAMVIVGGRRSLAGSIIGAAVLVAIPELLRLVGLRAESAAAMRQVMLGLAIVITLLLRPQGLAPHRNAKGIMTKPSGEDRALRSEGQ